MPDAYIVDAVRSPIGRRNGMLASVRADELAAQVLNGLIDRVGIDPAEVEDVQMGCVSQVGEQALNVGRVALLVAGWPETVCAATTDRQCGSSMQAAFNAAAAIQASHLDVVVAAGVENMSRVPMGSNLGPDGFAGFSEKLFERWEIVPQGISAEVLADEWDLSREALDAYSYESHRRAIAAIDEGRFEREIVPVEVSNPHVGVLFAVDETPRRDTSLEKLAALAPAFKADGVVTAGSSSQICDGAAAMLVVSDAAAQRLELEPRARFVSFGLAGVDPYRMLHGNPQACERRFGEGRPDVGRHGGDRGQRGIRVRRAPVPRRHGPRGTLAGGRREPQRRRHLARPPAGRDRCAHHCHADLGARAARRSLRHRDDVHRAGSGDRRDHRARVRGFSSFPRKPMTNAMLRMLLNLVRPLPRGRLALLHGPR